ncbi:MAG: VanW family protein [Lachnospiraceae bacterium]|nr:VanW family protein [Lachnospiraceae bacterium]
MKNYYGKTTFFAALLAVAAGAFCMNSTEALAAEEATIASGVSIEGMDVSGMTVEEANQVVGDYLHSYENATITLNADGKSVEATGADLGVCSVSDVATQAINYGKKGNPLECYLQMADLEAGKNKDFAITIGADTRTMKAYLADHEEDLVTVVVNNGLKRENDAFVYVPGVAGKKILINESVTHLADYLLNDWDGNDCSVDMSVISKEPEGSEEELKAVQDVLGSFNTSFGSSTTPRGINVANGTSKIDGVLLYPGESASVEHYLGAMTAENGYAPAASYENGKTVNTYGGGICQVSTTLYNALIAAELQIDERHAHSMVVGYVDLSRDAAIAEGVKDLKFTNNTDYPIYIEGYTANGSVYFNVWGKETRDPNRQVSFVSETLSTTYPINIYEGHPELPVGYVALASDKGHTGYKARLWKVVTVDGTEVSREIFNTSSYRVTHNVYAIGTGSENGDAVNAINAAIGTQDGPTIQSTAASWGDASLMATELPALQPEAQAQADAQAAAEAAAQAAAEQAAAEAAAQPAP